MRTEKSAGSISGSRRPIGHVEVEPGGEQRARIGMLRALAKTRAAGPGLDQPAAMQHGDVVGELGGERDIVRDEEQRQAVLARSARRTARRARAARRYRARWSARRR